MLRVNDQCCVSLIIFDFAYDIVARAIMCGRFRPRRLAIGRSRATVPRSRLLSAMAHLSFAAYARKQGYGGAFRIRQKHVPEDSYLTDLGLMLVLTRSLRSLPHRRVSTPSIFEAGITLETDINGLAEKIGEVHYASVTLGCSLTGLYCSEQLLAIDVLPEFGTVPAPPRAPIPILPGDDLLADPASLAAILSDIRTSDPHRGRISRYIAHLMVLFVFLHELHHCTLGHCQALEQAGIPSRLRERGAMPVATGINVGMYHSFELLADSHACDGVILAITSRLDLPTRLGLIDEVEPMKLRLAVLAISLSIAIWYSLDAEAAQPDLLHPPPLTRMFNIMDHFHDAIERRYSTDTAHAFIRMWLADLRRIAQRAPAVTLTYAGILRSRAEDILPQLIASRRRFS